MPNNKMEPIKQKAVFLDRDGTLIEEVDFLSRVEDLRLFPFTREALSRLRDAGYLLFVVTNQSGIGRGYFSESAVHSIHEKIQTEMAGAIEGFHFCPHLPAAGCRCRKPDTGMIEAAAREISIDIAESWMIGDKKIDIETGFNAGLRTALVKTGYGARHFSELTRMPDVAAENLGEAVDLILRFSPPDSNDRR